MEMTLQLQQNCCAGCQMPIKDRFIFYVIEQNFHQDCVRCADCSITLMERCFINDGKLYCRNDYWRRFGPKCSACQEPIKATELVQRVKENLVYHLDCFVCKDCKRHLQAGEQLYIMDERKLLCKRDFMNNVATANVSSANNQQSSSTTAKQASTTLTQIGNINGNHHNSSINNSSHPKSQSGVHDIDQGTNCLKMDTQDPNQENQETLSSNGEQLADLTAGVGDHLMEGDDLDDADDRSSTGDGADSHQANGNRASGSPRFAGHYVPRISKMGDEVLKGSNMLDCGDELVDANGKRRGPRTTIKPKQLEILRRAFSTAPKPSRLIREQLASETELNMRVIQVWFQNRRSKERRMKNSNGSARRNFLRATSRRLRVGGGVTSAPGGPVPPAGQQQSLIAGGRAGPKQSKQHQDQAQRQQQQPPQQPQQQQSSPLDATDHMLVAAPASRQHNSPSEFGGSSSGGFTYFSDSSNQGDAFAISATSQQQSQSQQQAQQQSQQQYQHTPAGIHDQPPANLMALGSPATAGQPPTNRPPQYQPLKSEPPAQMYAAGQAPPPQQQQLMMMGGHMGGGPVAASPAGHPMGQHVHLVPAQMMQTGQPMVIGGGGGGGGLMGRGQW